MPSHHERFYRPSGEYLVFTLEGIAVLLIMRRSNASQRTLGFGMDCSPGMDCSTNLHRWRIVKMTVGVSSTEYHSLHKVGAAVYIFMGEGALH